MHSSTMGRSLLWCPPLPPEKSSSPPLSSDGAFSAPPKMTFVLPPQPASFSLPGSASSHDVTSLHLEDLESFANEAFPEYVCQISWKIFESPAYSKYFGTWILKKIFFLLSWTFAVNFEIGYYTSVELEGVRGRGRTREKVEVWHEFSFIHVWKFYIQMYKKFKYAYVEVLELDLDHQSSSW